jgi:hypothetical protein
MRKFLLCGLLPALLLAGSAQASTILENFESDSLLDWHVTGDAWTVGIAAGNPTISPPEGIYFARSGAPNQPPGVLGEANTGTLWSSAFTVTYDTLSWEAAGWSGSPDNGHSYFQVLESDLNIRATIQTPQSDAWQTLTVDLIAAGLSAGDTFYFRAVDGNNGSSYSWMAMDNLQLTGAAVSETPEPATWSLMALSIAGIALGVRRRQKV